MSCLIIYHAQVCIGRLVFLKDLILRRNVGKGVVCGLNGRIMGDLIIPNEYVVVIVQEVFVAKLVTIDPLNSKVDVQLGVIMFWSAKFLREDLKGTT
jgi:hypothetical protein